MIGILTAGALLLLASAAPKALRPGSTVVAVSAARLPLGRLLSSRAAVRAAALVEATAALVVLLVGGRAAGAATAVVFLALTAFAWRMSSVAPGTDCGCFGGTASSPVTRWHVGTNAALAVVGGLAVLRPQPSLVAELASSPLLGLPLLVTTALLAAACYLLMTALPALLLAASGQETAR